MSPDDPVAIIIASRIDAILRDAQDARTYVEAGDLASAVDKMSSVCVKAGDVATTIRTIGV